jgi:hypothetical protein
MLADSPQRRKIVSLSDTTSANVAFLHRRLHTRTLRKHGAARAFISEVVVVSDVLKSLAHWPELRQPHLPAGIISCYQSGVSDLLDFTPLG